MDFIFTTKYLGNSIFQFALAGGLVLISCIVRFIICHLLGNLIEKRVQQQDINETVKKFRKPLGWIITLIFFFIACKVISWHSPVADRAINISFAIIIALVTCCACFRLIDLLLFIFKKKVNAKLEPWISKTSKAFVALLLLVLILQNLGYSISGLVAGLGIGGIAVALAAKDSLSNLFGSITIFLDNTFQVGDKIKVNGIEGCVESIGFRSTKIRTYAKTEISIPNSTISNATLDNYSRMPMRRVTMSLRFVLDTTAEKMQEIIDILNKILKETEGVNLEASSVYFSNFTLTSLAVEIIYFTNTTDWTEYMEIRQKINYAILREMKKIDAHFAQPNFITYNQAESD